MAEKKYFSVARVFGLNSQRQIVLFQRVAALSPELFSFIILEMRSKFQRYRTQFNEENLANILELVADSTDFLLGDDGWSKFAKLVWKDHLGRAYDGFAIYDMIGMLRFNADPENDHAIEWIEHAFWLRIKHDLRQSILQSYFNLCHIYLKTGRIEEAEQYFRWIGHYQKRVLPIYAQYNLALIKMKRGQNIASWAILVDLYDTIDHIFDNEIQKQVCKNYMANKLVEFYHQSQ